MKTVTVTLTLTMNEEDVMPLAYMTHRQMQFLLCDAFAEFRKHRANGNADAYARVKMATYPDLYTDADRVRLTADTTLRLDAAESLRRAAARGSFTKTLTHNDTES